MFLVVAISKQVLAYPRGPGCGALLTDGIVNRTIEVSGAYNSTVDKSHVLLNSSNAWCSGVLDGFQYVNIRFEKPATISGFEIQGRSSSNLYVTQFKVGFNTNDHSSLQFYPSSNNPEIFQMTPSSGDEIVRFQINETMMNMVAFYPSQWNEHICMRIELYGCVPVDGVYTPWSEWSRCSNSCGNGNKARYRTCSNPVPANNGQVCIGDAIQTEDCFGMSCPVDGGFSEWSNWTTCSATCGTGFQLRTRACTKPLPEHGGRSCEGKSAEGRKCKLRDCEVDNVNASSRKSDEEEDSNKYFIPMLVLAVGFALFIVITVGVCCVTNK